MIINLNRLGVGVGIDLEHMKINNSWNAAVDERPGNEALGVARVGTSRV